MKKKQWEYNEERHKNPVFEFDLNSFYFIIHNQKLMLFRKNGGEK